MFFFVVVAASCDDSNIMRIMQIVPLATATAYKLSQRSNQFTEVKNGNIFIGNVWLQEMNMVQSADRVESVDINFRLSH